jgi:hypothetical protein
MYFNEEHPPWRSLGDRDGFPALSGTKGYPYLEARWVNLAIVSIFTGLRHKLGLVTRRIAMG